MRDKCKCQSRAMELFAVQVDWFRTRWTQSTGTQLYVASCIRPRSHSAYDGTRYARRVLTHDKIRTSCFETASAPYHVICFFLFFFSFSPSLVSLLARSWSLVSSRSLSPRRSSVWCSGCVWLARRTSPWLWETERVPFVWESSVRVSENKEMCYARAANIYANVDWYVSL